MGTVQAVHGALCKYLQETFRSKKGAVIRGIARISWVKDPLLGQNPRPSFDLDTALARQGGINQLNPTTTGV